jgi:hypothetical protein
LTVDAEAIKALRAALADERQRAEVVAALAPHLPDRGIRPAVYAALELLERGHDPSAALRAIARRVVELDNPWLLRKTGDTLAEHVPDDAIVGFVRLTVAIPAGLRELRRRMLGNAAVRFASTYRTDAALLLLEVALDGTDDAWAGLRAAAVATYVSAPEDVQRLVDLVMRLEPPARAATLVQLAPRLEDGDPLLRTADEIDDPPTRFRLFAAWVARLPTDERQVEARELFAAAEGISRAIVVFALPKALAAEVTAGVDAILDELERAADEPTWEPNTWFWAAVEAALAGAEGRQRLAVALLQAAYGLDAEWRALALEAIAVIPGPELESVLPLAHDLVYGGPDRPTAREQRALERLSPSLAFPTHVEPVAPLVEEILSDVAPDARARVVMAALAPEIPEPQQRVERDSEVHPVRPRRPRRLEEPEYDLPLDEDEEYEDDFDDYDDFYAPRAPAYEAPAALPDWAEPGVAVVNTGFAEPDDPRTALDPRRYLQPGDLCFWVEVGEPDPFSIESQPVGLRESVDAGDRVTVALFPVTPGAEVLDDTGDLEVLADGSAVVVRPAAPVEDADLARRRLVFRVQILPGTRDFELRCSIFCRQLLVQSRLVRALVSERAAAPEPQPVVTSELDYVLFRDLRPGPLRNVAEHGLSLMVNGNGATHNLHALLPGDNVPITHSTRFEGGELQDMVDQARRALRAAAFDSPDPWREGDSYQYDEPVDRARLEKDMLELAVRGYRFYDTCINRLIGGRAASRRFEEQTLRPTRIQIAIKQHGGLLLPAALFYDHPLDTSQPELRLCPEFLGALDDVDAMTALACFDGRCPSRGDMGVVCPSGFWGYRHHVGLPLSIDEFGDDDGVTCEIGYNAQPHLGVAVSTDPRFVLRATHVQELRALRPDLGWHYAPTRDQVIELMRSTPTELLYFYCHGGVSQANAPFISVGGTDEPGITSDVFRAYRIWWSDPRPLVFINGCHTTALEPDTALDFVSRLVDTAGAAGVIGTEITTFEPLAGRFATECLRRFLGGEEIGAAVRGARLALLARGNPLGLIYIPFVMPSLRLVARSE